MREARFSDIPALAGLAERMHCDSIYAERCTMDVPLFKNMCMESIRSGNHCLYVSEKDGALTGFLMGCLDRIYGIGKEKYATDVFFYVGDRKDTRAAGRLLKAFVRWAESKDVVEIHCGLSDAIGSPERVSRMYSKLGFRQSGLMMTKEIINVESP